LVEDEWLESARDRALSIDGGPTWFSRMIKFYIIGDRMGHLEGKWRILDGKEGEWSDLIF
jgi:hypothetical protein